MTDLDKLNFLVEADILATQTLSVFRNLINGLRVTGFQRSKDFLAEPPLLVIKYIIMHKMIQ